MEFALVLIVAFVVAASAVTVTNALNQVRANTEYVREAEISLRTQLQAQVDDLHGKLLSHNWVEYGNTVGQRSAFDRAVQAESDRMTRPLGNGESLDDALNRLDFSGVEFNEMEGPTVG